MATEASDVQWEDVDATPGIEKADAEGLRQALADASKLWLAHDGLWFLEWEKRHGLAEAIEADAAAWSHFARLEAKRIMERLGLPPGGGVDTLAECLRHRLYANICRLTLHRQGDRALKLRMVDCRVQEARRRKGLPLFACKSVGTVEFTAFAQTVDPRFAITCLQCPPDEPTAGGYCEWVFTLAGE